MDTVIEIKDVSFSYSGGENAPTVLNNVNLSVEKGEFLVVLGRNGSGKSTLAKLINGLLIPKSGSVEVFGMSTLDKKKLFEIRKKAGMVFQNPDNQMVATIVEDDIAFGAENIGLSREETAKRIEFALDAVDMHEYRNATTARLSGGQKQRIAIAGVLAIKPDILILDESTAMLDPKGRREVLDVVSKLNKNEGMTVILITHFMEEAAAADRVVLMDGGQIVKSGTPIEIFDEETVKPLGLSLPRPAYIAARLRENGVPVKSVLTELELEDELCRLLPRA